jgi:NTE family protein
MKKLGVVLGGGGARGLAHIGFLKVLDEEKIPVSFITGSSMGAIIAAAYAAGVPAASIEEEATKISQIQELIKLIDFSNLAKNLFEGNMVRDFIHALIGESSCFEDLQIPLAVVATDLITSQSICLDQGPLLPAVLASISIPGVFPPVEIGQYRLVDGGVLNSVPVKECIALGAEKTIAVDIQFNPTKELPWQDLPQDEQFPIPIPDFFLDIYRSELIMISRLTQINLAENPPDLLLCPPLPADIDMFLSFPRAAEIIAMGEEETRRNLPLIRQLQSS